MNGQGRQNNNQGLYHPGFEHDSCGFGLFAQMDGQASHWTVRNSIHCLSRLTHRGAVAADGKSGDGCGLLLARPDGFLRAVAAESGIELGARYAVGMAFLHREPERAAASRSCLERALAEQGLRALGWRQVPTDPAACGAEALQSLPRIEQVFVSAPGGPASETDPDMRLFRKRDGGTPGSLAPEAGSDEGEEDDFERRLYVARRRAERLCEQAGDETFYVCSLSSRLLSYKGLVMPEFLPRFYPDLGDPRMTSFLCLFHQRFSTNTLPQWKLAQPFRHLAHNGEINTIRGNRNWSVARGPKYRSPAFPDLEALLPIVSPRDSDSCSLDNMLEFLLAGGMEPLHAMRLLIPPAWHNMESINPELRAYYRYNSMRLEPWDGPAGIVTTDGRMGVCILDRNGLRPARYMVTRDRYLTVGSEIGMYDCEPADVVAKGRLKPGAMLAIDTGTGELLLPEDTEARLQGRRPYRRWLERHAQRLADLQGRRGQDDAAPQAMYSEWHPSKVLLYRKLFQLTGEECDQVLRVLAEQGQEAVGSMGDDTPLPALSRHVRSLYDSFRQQFAQVTNPAIDSLRERIVMSLATWLGREPATFEERPEHARRIEIDSPVLSEDELALMLGRCTERLPHARIELHYSPERCSLREAVETVAWRALAAVRAGKTLLVLSDRDVHPDVRPIHALLAVGAVHQRLVREGLRCDANIVVETATARDPHHFAVLIGYGATAVFPYLAYATLRDLRRRRIIPAGDEAKLIASYRRGIDKALYKILSKMGISTVASYRGAQLFEIVGLHEEIVDLCFAGTASRIQGIRFADLERDQEVLAGEAWNRRKPVRQGGLLKFVHGGEFHAFNPDVVTSLHRAVESDDYETYRKFSAQVHGRPVTVLRDLLRLREDVAPVPLDEVEPIEDILVRFDTAGMSLGALSPRAHEALAQAMNAIGGRSNSGEGGESSTRFHSDKNSKIKQVASGRFGVTPHYLVNAEVLQIKIAQGAKPGEGGQLPGDKVNEMIARLRHSKPGVSLISPPPHHDIYSIEDLAQLIFDLKQVNPQALVSVKLVATAGVGTIAAGVAKAYADLITIAGYDGGTGASPLTSVKYAGGPWELGLSETHQVLRANRLRDRVRVQVDGGLKTGLDVVKAAILGAESFGFGTAPMIALGCKYLRICHLNNCATGVATQDPTLYGQHFKPDGPRKAIRYFRFVAREAREWLAALGARSLPELIGRTDLFEVLPGDTERQGALDLTPVLSAGGVEAGEPQYCLQPRNTPFDKGELAERMVADALDAIEDKRGGEFRYEVRNYHRSIGARLSGEIARRHGDQGMNAAPVRLQLRGTAGQSLGVWNAGGLELRLEGDANDYVGKGMAGGLIAIYPPRRSRFRSEETVIMGNACLYGATGGHLFAAGVAGERFAVRNSGAVAVVEGVGDHGCEYMTGGVVVVLGETGVNFGAGMTGGFAFVLDRDGKFRQRCNPEFLEVHHIDPEAMRQQQQDLRELIDRHARETRSRWSRRIAMDFGLYLPDFWLIRPKRSALSGLSDYLRAA